MDYYFIMSASLLLRSLITFLMCYCTCSPKGLLILAACTLYLARADYDDETLDSSDNAASRTCDGDDSPSNSTTEAAATASGATSLTASDNNTETSVAVVAVASSDSTIDKGMTSNATASATATASDNSTASVNATSTSETNSNEIRIGFLHENRILCICNINHNPVCGTNGVTYSNKCVLDCVSNDEVLNNRSSIRILYQGECRTTPCNCPKVEQPVCGSNKVTYINDCYLACYNARSTKAGLAAVFLAYRGICMKEACTCPGSIAPVCGTDGKTYRNMCVLQCYSRINQRNHLPAIFANSTGACKSEKCNCPPIMSQLCANDDNTYHNYCALVCENRRRNQLGLESLTIQHPGECKKCICPLILDPVCASDGKTYSNYCLLFCENDKRRCRGQPDLTVRWRGPCDCGCTWEWKPVCASDQRTWANQCQLRCENKKRASYGFPAVAELYDGECKECPCDFCPRVPNPVCGSDHHTYLNICLLDCKSYCRINYGLPPIWKVPDADCLY